LIAKRFNRPSNNRTDDALADAVIKILRSTYADFAPTLATEKLRREAQKPNTASILLKKIMERRMTQAAAA